MFLVNAIIIFITLLNIILYYLRQHQEEEEEYGERSNGSPLSSDRLCRRFSLAEIKLATQNFNEALVVGKGGFGKVYKGIIDDGASTVAIKRLDSGSKQGAPEFWTEIQMLSKFRHSHLVSLIGYCNHQREMIIVYQYMPGGTLEANLHKIRRSDGDNVSSLSWEQRLKICIGAARGLNYLHTGTSIQHRVIHRDVKSSNILLDENWEAKISDFGLSRIGLTDQPNTHVTTHVKGTFGYIDPEYFLTRRLTRKSDVYAFGVVLFEALCGRPAVDKRLAEEQWVLAFWAKHCIKEGRLLEFVDPSLRGSISSNCLLVFAEIAGQCLQNSSKRRPTMSEVVTRLEYALALQEGTNSAAEDVDIISDTDGHEHLEDADLYTETEASNAGHNNEQIVRITQLGAGTSRSQSDNKPARTMTFVNKVRLFFSARAPVVSDELSDLCTGLGKRFPLRELQVATDNFDELSDLCTGLGKRFPLRELQVATDNFGNKNLVGRGGFGDVYKGRLANGSLVAIKRYKYKRTLSRKLEFLKNVEIIGLALHRNLLQLLGFCMTPTEWLLVYPFMDNGSVASHLWERSESQSSLSWRRRKQVALGAARGLAYLHDDCISTIIHGNVKAANILLDNEFEVVIGDFGLTKVMDHNDTHVTTAVRGTIGQIAPEYLSTGKCSQKTDVFEYGVMLLELITRQRAYDLARLTHDDNGMLLDWVSGLLTKNRLETVIDEGLQGDYVFEDAEQLLQLALLCTQNSPTKRPTMSEVVRMLQGDGLAERWEVWLNDDKAVLLKIESWLNDDNAVLLKD